ASAPSAVVREDGAQSVFYLVAGGRLFESRWDGGPWWSAPYDRGLVLTSAPAAVVPRPGRIEVYGVAIDHTLARATFDSAWQTDTAIADPVFVERPAVSCGVGGVRVFSTASGVLEARTVGVAGLEVVASSSSAPGACTTGEVFFTGTDAHAH